MVSKAKIYTATYYKNYEKGQYIQAELALINQQIYTDRVRFQNGAEHAKTSQRIDAQTEILKICSDVNWRLLKISLFIS